MKYWLALALVLLTPGAALACGPDAAPAAAAAQGLTCEVFVDSMTSTSTFDVNDTRAAGFNWYVHQAWPNAAQTATWTTATSPTPSSDYTVGAGGTVLSPALDNYPISMISTCAYSGTSYVGAAFQPPFYIDVTFTSSGTAQGPQWPAVWMAPTEFLTAGNGVTMKWVELDMFESPFTSQDHIWNCTGGGCSNTNSYAVTQVGSVTGMMVLPSSLTRVNNDTSTDVVTFGPSITPSGTTGTFCCSTLNAGDYQQISTNHYCLMLTAGPGQPMTVTKVAVWAAPPNSGRFPRRVKSESAFDLALRSLP